jgi:general secretion pathway protein D
MMAEEREENSSQAVPGLGAIPIIGQLFRYEARKKVKTNLLVFLRPVIVRTPDTAYGITADRYEYIQQLRGDAVIPKHWLLPDFPSKQMPPLPPKQNPDGSYPAGTDPSRIPPSVPPSLAPDVSDALKRRELDRAKGVIQTAPNEVIIPIPLRTMPEGMREEPSSNSK